MKQFLLGAALTVAVTAAAGFAVARSPAKMVPLKLSDLTLDRAFRYEFAAGVSSGSPVSFAFPPAPTGFGVVVTRIESDQYTYNPPQVFYSVDGGPHASVKSGFFVAGAAPSVAAYIDGTVDPPLVVYPGQTISFSSSNPNGTPSNIVVCGYIVYPGEV